MAVNNKWVALVRHWHWYGTGTRTRLYPEWPQRPWHLSRALTRFCEF
ncbi:MAG: hypothetical protein RIK87_27910 [Fuerstiella sp.]